MLEMVVRATEGNFVCLFDLGLTSFSTIFQSYRDSVWMWQGAQCSLKYHARPRHFDMIFHPSHYTDTELTSSSSTFLMLSDKRKSS